MGYVFACIIYVRSGDSLESLFLFSFVVHFKSSQAQTHYLLLPLPKLLILFEPVSDNTA